MARTEFLLKVVLEYDDFEVTGHEAQKSFLDELTVDYDFHLPNDYGKPYYRVHLNSAKGAR